MNLESTLTPWPQPKQSQLHPTASDAHPSNYSHHLHGAYTISALVGITDQIEVATAEEQEEDIIQSQSIGQPRDHKHQQHMQHERIGASGAIALILHSSRPRVLHLTLLVKKSNYFLPLHNMVSIHRSLSVIPHKLISISPETPDSMSHTRLHVSRITWIGCIHPGSRRTKPRPTQKPKNPTTQIPSKPESTNVLKYVGGSFCALGGNKNPQLQVTDRCSRT